MNENIKIIIFDVDDTLIYTIDTAYKKTSLAGKKVYNMRMGSRNTTHFLYPFECDYSKVNYFFVEFLRLCK